MPFDDLQWEELRGGYGIHYDPRPALQELETGPNTRKAWDELWNELHHQGDVGEASYAAVPLLVQIHKTFRKLGWNLYALAATIEIERHRRSNPPLPPQLAEAYRNAWHELVLFAIDDLRTAHEPELIQSALGVVALGRGTLKLGAVISYLDSSEVDEILDEKYAWSEIYDDAVQPRIVSG